MVNIGTVPLAMPSFFVIAGTSAHVVAGAILKLPVLSSGGYFSTATASAGGITVSAPGPCGPRAPGPLPAGPFVSGACPAVSQTVAKAQITTTTAPPRIRRADQAPVDIGTILLNSFMT